MVIEYSKKYDEDIKGLLVELQQHIMGIDLEKYTKISKDYGNVYFEKVMEEVNRFEGIIYLYVENDKAVGMIAGIINNEETKSYDFVAPKRGRISELVVSKSARGKGIGSKLINKMEEHFYNNGCKSILLPVFAYNTSAIEFYERHGYHNRMLTMIKTIEK